MARLTSGFNMPPGCFRTPGDETSICAVCCKVDDACICPECPVCHSNGDPKCYKPTTTNATLAKHGIVHNQGGHNMRLTPEQVIAREDARLAILRERLSNAQTYRDQLAQDLQNREVDDDIFDLATSPDPFA